MSDPVAARSFLVGETEALEPFDFVAVRPRGKPFQVVEIVRVEGGGLEVHVPGRPPVAPQLPDDVRKVLGERGFASENPANPMEPWTRAVGGSGEAVDLALALIVEAFDQKPDVGVDVVHGSRRAEHEAKQKLEVVRKRIEGVIGEISESPPEQDADGDYPLLVDGMPIMLAPRAAPGGPVVVRVFAITNVGVNVASELGLFLARLNFGLMFGRFALDTDHSAVWFDETLLGEHFSDEELRFAIEVVSTTAAAWDARLKQLFGGVTYREARAQQGHPPPPTNKPGQGLYL